MTEKQSRIANILAFFSEMYNKPLTENTIVIYIDILEGFELPQIEKAFKSLVRDHALSRFPLPADFIKHLEPPAELDDKATMAWLTATRKMELEGKWHTVKFDDPLIHHTIARFGGWVDWGNRLQAADEHDLIFIQKDFERVYRNCAKTVEPDEDVPLLIGNCDSQNLRDGYISEVGGEIKRIVGAKGKDQLTR